MFPVSHSILDASALAREAATRYDIPAPAHCELVSRGTNDIYELHTAGARFSIRVARANWRTDENLAHQHALAIHLAAHAIPVAAPLRAHDGSTIFRVEAPEGTRPIALFPWLPGVVLAEVLDEDRATTFGALVGRMHEAVGSFRPDWAHPIDDIGIIRARLALLQEMIAHRNGEAAFYESIVSSTAEAFANIDGAQVARGFIHGDVHLENAIVSNDGTIALIDFDNCGEDFLAKELASFTWRNTYIGLSESINEAFRVGYENVRPLSPEEAQLAPLFELMRNLFILTGHAANVNKAGRTVGIVHDLDTFVGLTRRYAGAAGLL
jgi:Ser/Thr protein kinase RdoA (MazF antagonist)